MTGAEHYQEAEKLLAAYTDDYPEQRQSDLITRSQVHATLALAAFSSHAGTGTGQRNDPGLIGNLRRRNGR